MVKASTLTFVVAGDSGPPIWWLPNLRLKRFEVTGAKCVEVGCGWLYWCISLTIGLHK